MCTYTTSGFLGGGVGFPAKVKEKLKLQSFVTQQLHSFCQPSFYNPGQSVRGRGLSGANQDMVPPPLPHLPITMMMNKDESTSVKPEFFFDFGVRTM